jgi:hypothetical protein
LKTSKILVAGSTVRFRYYLTIYDSVASSKLFRYFCFHSRGHSSWKVSAKVPELSTSLYSISRTVRTYPLVNHGDLPLREALNWSCSSLFTTAVRYILSWLSSTQIWMDTHLIAPCFICLPLLVRTAFLQYESWVIFLVNTIALSQWTYSFLRCCRVSPPGALHEASVVRPNSAPIPPGGSVSAAMACCCRNVRTMITKISGKCWKFCSEQHVKMKLVAQTIQGESCCVQL